MAYKLTERTKNALSREQIEPNLVLAIEGLERKYAVRIAQKLLRYDMPENLKYDEGYNYDGLIPDGEGVDLISLTGTSTSISQQLEPDKGGASSTQTLTLKMIDRNEEITQLISPGVVVNDLMYTNAKLYFGLYDTSFPEDYLEIFNGKIMGINPAAGSIDLVVTHPDDVKRASIYEKRETKVFTNVNFDSAQIQSLFYQKRPDVLGSVSVTYVFAAIGDDAIVSILGNDITVQVDNLSTTAKTLKKKIENHEDANQLVTVKIIGTPTTIQIPQAQTFLSQDTEVVVDDVFGFLLPSPPLFRTFLKINDEIIEYAGIDVANNKFTGCTRQALTSFGATHEVGDQVSSFYQLGDASFENGNAINLALWLLLSGADQIYATDQAVSCVTVPALGFVENAVFFSGKYLIRDHNVQAGDTCSMAGSTHGNDFTNKLISSVTETDLGTYLIISGVTLVNEVDATLSLTFQSQYNILPDGAGLLPNQVDIAQFLLIKTRHSTAISNYAFYFKDTVNAKDFINTEVFLPSAMYSVPRKGKVSCGITAPILYDENTKTLTLESVKLPASLKLQRSVNNNFYNAVAYKYDQDSVQDTFLAKHLTISAESSNRIGAPARVFLLESTGLRPSLDTSDIITRNSKRFLDRYKFGAEQIKVSVLFKTGFGVEVGDAALFGDSSFGLSDTKKGSKDFSPRIMEVTNKDWNWKTGDISLTLLDTTYSSEVRFGVFSPSSVIGAGSTASRLSIKDSFGTTFPAKEKDKWQNYIGREIVIHSEDWSIVQSTYIQEFDPTNDYVMTVSPALGLAPSEGDIIDIVSYPEVDPLESFYKNVHCFYSPEVAIVSGFAQTQFDVGAGDVSKFFVGCLIRVHNEDYSIDSGETGFKVEGISGTTITCGALGFIPDSTMLVDLIGFSEDNGKPYAWL